jgi:hypothetical protein
MRTRLRRFGWSAITTAGLALAVAPATWAVPFSKARLFFELNDTDGDLGIHALIDGDAYAKLEIKDPHNRRIFLIKAFGRLARQGLTELSFESDEPSFDDLSPAEFFLRFPEGEYDIEARSLEGEEIEGEALLSHVMAAPASNLTISGAAAVANCDVLPLPSASEPVIIDWDPVTTSHPTIGNSGPIQVEMYQIAVEQGNLKLSVDLPPTMTQFQVPAAITALGGVFKFEVLVRTTSGNNTATESCYTVP